jgi:hypothetical protein
VNVVVVIDAASIASLKVAETALFRVYPAAPAAGVVLTTVGGMAAGAEDPSPPPHAAMQASARDSSRKIPEIFMVTFIRFSLFQPCIFAKTISRKARKERKQTVTRCSSPNVVEFLCDRSAFTRANAFAGFILICPVPVAHCVIVGHPCGSAEYRFHPEIVMRAG